MKVTRKAPQKEFIIVRTDGGESGDNSAVYECFLVTPVSMGNIIKQGSQRVMTEDGLQFANIESAVRHMMVQAGEPEVAGQARTKIKNNPKWRRDFEFTVKDLVMRDKWEEYCEMRKVHPAISDLREKVYLNELELAKLGLTG